MLARIFINRPVLACVLSVVILLLGGIAAGLLPVAEYPEVTPPMVRVTAYYPGANAQVVADTVAAPIEQQVNGVENMMYMSSQCTNDGNYTLTVTFKHGARVELGAQGYDQACTLDGRPTVALSVYQRPGSNALETADLVRAKMKELKDRFPAGVD